MEVGVHYVVTVGGDDETLMVGDHIRLEPNGNIICANAMGWISANDVWSALYGAEYEADNSDTASKVWDLHKKAGALQSQLLSHRALSMLYVPFD